MVVSAKALFHFTRRFDRLVDILHYEFQPRYVLEDFATILPELKPSNQRQAIPMTCFCDIPISNIKNHIIHYGSYGIGLSKEWGEKNLLNPILYISEGSSVSNYLQQLFNEIGNLEERRHGVFPPFFESLSYLKPYKGTELNGKIIPERTFYDEREWRYVPLLSEMSESQFKAIRLTEEQHADEDTLYEANTAIAETCKLKFEPTDIKYIIVDKEHERLPIIHAIQDAKRRYSYDVVLELASKVWSVETILADF